MNNTHKGCTLIYSAEIAAELDCGNHLTCLRARAVDSGSNGIVIARASPLQEQPIIYANPAFERMTGYDEAEVIGRSPFFLHGEDVAQPDIGRLSDASCQGIAAKGVLRNYTKGGKLLWTEVSVAPVHDPEGRLTHCIYGYTDVSERANYQAELERQANHDSLTGLANRNLLGDRLEHALALAGRHDKTIAVIVVNLDRFRDINDGIGHAVGDRLLQDVSLRIVSCMRDVDTVARVGGDEFVLIVADVESEHDVMTTMGRILTTVTGQYQIAGHELHVACSLGASLYPRDGQDADSLLRNADTAMYRAKGGGRNRFQFYEREMNARLSQRLALESGLRHALERDELELEYQPQISLAGGFIVGFEALLRWRHPQLGLVPPPSFISVAEDTGLIVPIGDWVLQEACARLRTWLDAGLPPTRIAVNLSARQFHHKGLSLTITQALQDYHLDAEALELEITESMAMGDPEESIMLLRGFKEHGLRIALDDFGTGFSCLSYLKRFPIDVLKIDQSFVRGIVCDRSDAAIASTVIGLARSLWLQTIAEGVETEEQASLLHRWTCDEAQGFHFSKPLDVAAATALLAAGTRFERPLSAAA